MHIYDAIDVRMLENDRPISVILTECRLALRNQRVLSDAAQTAWRRAVSVIFAALTHISRLVCHVHYSRDLVRRLIRTLAPAENYRRIMISYGAPARAGNIGGGTRRWEAA
jgi:hypothetical protein